MTRGAAPTEPFRNVVWPPTCFYWTEIDASSLGTRPTRRELEYLLESDLPVPLESVHATFVRVDDAAASAAGRGSDRGSGQGSGGSSIRFLACAVEHGRLRDELPEGAISLRPESPPEFLAGRVDCASLDLLFGRWEPPILRRMRRAWIAVSMSAIVLCMGAVSLGLQRRTSFERSQAAAVETLRRQVLQGAIGPAGLQPNADMVLASELSRLQATRQAPPGVLPGGLPGVLPGAGADRAADAADVLATALAHWPTDVHLRTESLSASGEGIAINGTVAASADAQRVADALGRVESGESASDADGWRVDQPRFETRSDGVSVSIRLRREGAQR